MILKKINHFLYSDEVETDEFRDLVAGKNHNKNPGPQSFNSARLHSFIPL